MSLFQSYGAKGQGAIFTMTYTLLCSISRNPLNFRIRFLGFNVYTDL